MIAARDDAKNHGAVVVAETACRFLRSVEFHPSIRADAQPTEEEYQHLFRFMQGVPMAQLYPTYFHWRQARSLQSSRGQQAKGRKGGRPRKHYRPRWNKCLREVAKALQLHHQGWSFRAIGEELGRSHSTIQEWCKTYVYEFDEVCIRVSS